MKFHPILPVLFIGSASALNLFRQTASDQTVVTVQGAPVPGDSPLVHCGSTADDALTIDRVDLTPNPPVPGEPLNIKATGVLHKVVTDGSFVLVTVKYGMITLVKETIDLCEHVKEVGLECPIDKGRLVLTKKIDMPKQIPPGKYFVITDAHLVDGSPLTCLLADVVFPRTF